VIAMDTSTSITIGSSNAISQAFDGGGLVLLPRRQKYPPIENGWQKKPHTYEEAIAHLEEGGNVGIMAG
jgi:hypothetical protein